MKNKVLTVVRAATGLICWFLIYKLYGAFIDPLLEGILPEIIRMIIASMVIPYTLGLGAYLLVTLGMPHIPLSKTGTLKPGAGTIAKYFAIQTGLSFPVMIVINSALTIAGVKSHALSPEDILSHPVFYVFLLLVFNPVFEELLFRKFMLERLSTLGTKGAIICSAVFFALPHVYSQGVAQMFFTFALGLVWAYLTVRTGRLWPAIVLHLLSNVYCGLLPIFTGMVHTMLSLLFVVVSMAVFIPLSIVLIRKEARSGVLKSDIGVV